MSCSREHLWTALLLSDTRGVCLRVCVGICPRLCGANWSSSEAPPLRGQLFMLRDWWVPGGEGGDFTLSVATGRAGPGQGKVAPRWVVCPLCMEHRTVPANHLVGTCLRIPGDGPCAIWGPPRFHSQETRGRKTSIRGTPGPLLGITAQLPPLTGSSSHSQWASPSSPTPLAEDRPPSAPTQPPPHLTGV